MKKLKCWPDVGAGGRVRRSARSSWFILRGTMNVWTTSHHSPSNSCRDSSVWINHTTLLLLKQTINTFIRNNIYRRCLAHTKLICMEWTGSGSVTLLLLCSWCTWATAQQVVGLVQPRRRGLCLPLRERWLMAASSWFFSLVMNELEVFGRLLR